MAHKPDLGSKTGERVTRRAGIVALNGQLRELTKAELCALEKVFAAEIEDRLPFQSRAAVFKRLCDDGMIEAMERTFGGRFQIKVTGWQLTHAGRLAYCSSCSAAGE